MNNLMYLTFAMIIGIMIGTMGCICIFNSIKFNNNTNNTTNNTNNNKLNDIKNIKKGGNLKDDLFTKLVPTIENFGIDGFNNSNNNDFNNI